MADEAQTQTIRAVNWREVFPCTHLFRAFRIAVHPSKLLLALAALLLIYLGGRVLDGVWADKYKPLGLTDIHEYVRMVEMPGGGALPQRVVAADVERHGIFITFFEYQVGLVNAI